MFPGPAAAALCRCAGDGPDPAARLLTPDTVRRVPAQVGPQTKAESHHAQALSAEFSARGANETTPYCTMRFQINILKYANIQHDICITEANF